jgi:hypothetical protein
VPSPAFVDRTLSIALAQPSATRTHAPEFELCPNLCHWIKSFEIPGDSTQGVSRQTRWDCAAGNRLSRYLPRLRPNLRTSFFGPSRFVYPESLADESNKVGVFTDGKASHGANIQYLTKAHASEPANKVNSLVPLTPGCRRYLFSRSTTRWLVTSRW